MILDVTWRSIEERLKEIGQGATAIGDQRQDEVLLELGLIDNKGLTPQGERLYMAQHVLQDPRGMSDALAETLIRQPIVNALLATLWPVGAVRVSGAVNLLMRLTKDQNEQNARRWLTVLNQAGLVAYNRNNANMRILFNPAQLTSQAEDEARERDRAHVISPETPYGNILALRELLRAARGAIRWWEPHMPGKVFEVLYRELDGSKVNAVRLLSGPANVSDTLKADYKTFRGEMKKKREIDVAWRVLSKQAAFEHHDRFFITEGMSRNLPPLNTILAGSTGEILPSRMSVGDFDSWWAGGVDLESFKVDPAT